MLCVLVGTARTVCRACGADLRLVGAACYLAAVAVMREHRRKVETSFDGEDRKLTVHSHTACNGENVKELRTTQPDHRHITRVVEIGSTVIRHSLPGKSSVGDTL